MPTRQPVEPLPLFLAPISKEELHGHVATVQLALARQLQFCFGRDNKPLDEVYASLFGMPGLKGVSELDLDASNIGITYEAIRETWLATELEALYSFAYHGMHADGGANWDSESGAAWCSMVLHDMKTGRAVHELNEFFPCQAAAQALFEVCETAQARLVLEEMVVDDRFMDWHPGGGEDLSIRQMSLLSGMTEQSLRTMASPSRSNPLPVSSVGRSTVVKPKAAREWLASKGRYVPLVRSDVRGAVVDLANDTIEHPGHLVIRLQHRLDFLLGQDEAPSVRGALKRIDPALLAKAALDGGTYLNLGDNDPRLADERFMRKLARALHLPEDQLVLKAAHLRALAVVQEIEQKLQSGSTAPKSPKK